MKIQAALIKKPRKRHRFFSIKKRFKQRPEKVVGLAAFCCLLTGLIGGMLLELTFPEKLAPGLLEQLTRFIQAECSSFSAMFLTCFLPPIGLGLLVIYLGYSPVGSPGIGALLFLRACGLGALAVYLASLGKTGLSFYYLCLLPSKALQISGLFFLSRRAMQLSGYYKSCLKRDSFHAEPVLRRYLIACLPGFALLLFSSLADTFLYLKISPSFESLLY